MTPEQRRRQRIIVLLYRSGLSSTAIGQLLGLSRHRILQLLQYAGEERRACGNPRRTIDGQFAKRFEVAP